MELWELLVREAARDTIARYNNAGDHGHLEELAACFTTDGVMDIKGREPFVGRAAIVAELTVSLDDRLSSRAGAGFHVHHHVASTCFLAVAAELVETASHCRSHLGRSRPLGSLAATSWCPAVTGGSSVGAGSRPTATSLGSLLRTSLRGDPHAIDGPLRQRGGVEDEVVGRPDSTEQLAGGDDARAHADRGERFVPLELVERTAEASLEAPDGVVAVEEAGQLLIDRQAERFGRGPSGREPPADVELGRSDRGHLPVEHALHPPRSSNTAFAKRASPHVITASLPGGAVARAHSYASASSGSGSSSVAHAR